MVPYRSGCTSSTHVGTGDNMNHGAGWQNCTTENRPDDEPSSATTRCTSAGMRPLLRRSSIIPELTTTCPSGGTTSNQPSGVLNCNPRLVARGNAVTRLMSAGASAQTYSAEGACSIGG